MSLVCGLTKRMALHNTNLCQTIHVHLEMKCEENQLLCPTWFSKHWKKALYNTVYSIYIYILVTWPRIARNHQIYAFQLFTTSSASSSATPWFCNWGKVPLKSYWQLFTSPAVSKIKDVERYHHQEIRKDTTGSSDWRISWHGFLQQSNCASRGWIWWLHWEVKETKRDERGGIQPIWTNSRVNLPSRTVQCFETLKENTWKYYKA